MLSLESGSIFQIFYACVFVFTCFPHRLHVRSYRDGGGKWVLGKIKLEMRSLGVGRGEGEGTGERCQPASRQPAAQNKQLSSVVRVAFTSAAICQGDRDPRPRWTSCVPGAPKSTKTAYRSVSHGVSRVVSSTICVLPALPPPQLSFFWNFPKNKKIVCTKNNSFNLNVIAKIWKILFTPVT